MQDLELATVGKYPQRENRCVLCFWGGTGDEMGRNELSVFVYNESKWGDMGRNRLSPLEMGSKGRGEGIQVPQADLGSSWMIMRT